MDKKLTVETDNLTVNQDETIEDGLIFKLVQSSITAQQDDTALDIVIAFNDED